MILSNVNIGTGPSTGDGDPIRTAFNIINENFAKIEANVLPSLNSVTSVAGRDGAVSLTVQDITGILSYINTIVNTSNIANLLNGSQTVSLGLDGNLTLAGNTSSINYINGVSILADLYANAASQHGQSITANTNMQGYADAITVAWTANAGIQAGQITTANVNMQGYADAITNAWTANAIVQHDEQITANVNMQGYADDITLAWTANAIVQPIPA
jgi:hypothetical protein